MNPRVSSGSATVIIEEPAERLMSANAADVVLRRVGEL
jgi:hypothetical protein